MTAKRDQILDAMEELMADTSPQAISLTDIARKAQMGKSSIYYYFSSKSDIINEVIRRACSRVLEKGKALAEAPDMNCFQKMEIIYQTCLDCFKELHRHEASGSFYDRREYALIYQTFAGAAILSLKPVLGQILEQGAEEGALRCSCPEETAQIILTVLIITLGNTIVPAEPREIHRILRAFTELQANGLSIAPEQLAFLTEREEL